MQKIHDLPTPCLVLDLDQFESNLDSMARFAAGRDVALRPHAKTHKCVEIARRQIEKGAIGISVATIAEAEVMARGGIRGLLITAEMVGEPKVSRLMAVAAQAPDTMTVVDDAENVRELQKAAEHAGIELGVLIDLDVGQNRTGVKPQLASGVAEAIQQSKNLSLKGICAYAGHVAHVVGFDERRAASRRAMDLASSTRDMLRRTGHEFEIFSGASTGTYNIDPDTGITELQSGSYVFMDVDYRRIGGQDGAVYEDFSPALTVLATVVHRSDGKAIVDAGLKAFATDRPFGPEALGLTGCTFEFAGDEHGRLLLDKTTRDLRLGDKLRFIMPHCDPTVNLYDRMWCVRDDKVLGFWSIMDRAAAGPYF